MKLQPPPITRSLLLAAIALAYGELQLAAASARRTSQAQPAAPVAQQSMLFNGYVKSCMPMHWEVQVALLVMDSNGMLGVFA